MRGEGRYEWALLDEDGDLRSIGPRTFTDEAAARAAQAVLAEHDITVTVVRRWVGPWEPVE